MKPRSRPGKAAGSRSSQIAQARAKALSPEQISHLNRERTYRGAVPKAGKGGRRACWDTDYEEGCRFAAESMPCREFESVSQEEIRRHPKKGH